MKLPFISGSGTESSSKRKALELAVMCIGGLLVFFALASAGLALVKMAGGRDAVRVEEALQLADASDAALLRAVEGRAELLQELGDEELQRELSWRLVDALMDRGLLAQAQNSLDGLIDAEQPESMLWAARMQKAARALAMIGQQEKSQNFLKRIEKVYAEWNQLPELENAARERAILLAFGSGEPLAERLAEVEGLISLLKELPAAQQELQVLRGKLLREQGEREKAETCFRETLSAAVDPQQASFSTRMCMGIACLELGDEENGEKWLRTGLEELPNGRDHVGSLYAAMGLQYLAVHSLSAGRAQSVLDLLYRAGICAQGKVPSSSMFWFVQAEQRAWALYMAQAYEESLKAFQRVLDAASQHGDKLKLQPLEGVSRCLLALGQVSEALPYIEECVYYRERICPEDLDGFGRAILLLAQVYDQAGQTDKAVEIYSHAAQTLPKEHSMHPDAMAGHATALEHAEKWEAAVQVWQNILTEMPEGDSVQKSSVTERLELCRKRLQDSLPKAVPAKPAPKASSKAPSKAAPKSSSRTTRSRNKGKSTSRSRRSR